MNRLDTVTKWLLFVRQEIVIIEAFLEKLKGKEKELEGEYKALMLKTKI